MKHLIGLVVFIIGLVLSVQLPDIDQSTDLLTHRSILTHGPLIPIVLFAIASPSKSIPIRWFAMSVSIGFVVHLAFDLFPHGWLGYALIHIPAYGRAPAVFSLAWIAMSVILCAYLSARLARRPLETILFILGIIGIFGNAALHEDALWGPAATVAAAAIIALLCSRDTPARAQGSDSL